MKIIKILVLFIMLFLFSIKTYALENGKALYLKAGISYLISFDEKITDLKYDNRIINIENISSIFSNNRQIIIKPVTNADSKLVVTTGVEIYTFNIVKESDNPVIIELDNPPEYTNSSNGLDFDIDPPPELKKK